MWKTNQSKSWFRTGDSSVMAAVIGLGGWGEIVHGLKQLQCAPLYMLMSNLNSLSLGNQLLVAMEGSDTRILFC